MMQFLPVVVAASRLVPPLVVAGGPGAAALPRMLLAVAGGHASPHVSSIMSWAGRGYAADACRADEGSSPAGGQVRTRHPSTVPPDVEGVMQRVPIYDTSYLESIQPRHLPPELLRERLAFRTIGLLRSAFDKATGYRPNRDMSEAQWLRRVIFLETVAGVPGMVGGMLRHLRSLRLMKRDNGWINTLLQEAENERMHLLTFMEMRKPGIAFRSAVIGAQAVMFSVFLAAYAVSPKFCHALVGYLEEEAVKTYTHALEDIDAGKLWPGVPAPPIALAYWRLREGASMRDLILAVRADEQCHSHVNHTLARIPQDAINPFLRGDAQQVP